MRFGTMQGLRWRDAQTCRFWFNYGQQSIVFEQKTFDAGSVV